MDILHKLTPEEISAMMEALGGSYWLEKYRNRFGKHFSERMTAFAFVIRLQTLIYDIQIENAELPKEEQYPPALFTLVNMGIKDAQFLPDTVPPEFAAAVYDIILRSY